MTTLPVLSPELALEDVEGALHHLGADALSLLARGLRHGAAVRLLFQNRPSLAAARGSGAACLLGRRQ